MAGAPKKQNRINWQPSSSLQGPSGPVARCWPLRGQRLILKDTSMLHSSSCAALLCLCCIYFDYVVIKNHMYWQPSSSLQGPSGPVACCWPLRGQRLIFKDISMLHLSFLLFYFDHVVTKNHIDWPSLIFKHNSELYYSDCVVYLFIMKPLRPSRRPAGLGQANTHRFKNF